MLLKNVESILIHDGVQNHLIKIVTNIISITSSVLLEVDKVDILFLIALQEFLKLHVLMLL